MNPAAVGLVLFVLGTNIPLGYWRGRVRKFSWQWIAAIHASIPFIYLLRKTLHLSPWTIPFTAAALFGGQYIGSRRARAAAPTGPG